MEIDIAASGAGTAYGSRQKRWIWLAALGVIALILTRPLGGLIWLNYGAMVLHRAVLHPEGAAEIEIAESAFRNSMALAPSRAAARNLAFAAYAREDYPTVLREAEAAGGHPLMHWLSGQAYDALGNDRMALQAWRNIDGTGELAVSYFTKRARNALMSKDLREAERYYRMALALEPNSAVALSGLGETLYGTHPDVALAALEAALAEDPSLHRTHFLTGGLYEKRGEAEVALDHFIKAAELAPEISPYAGRVADVYARLGDSREAEYWRARAVEK